MRLMSSARTAGPPAVRGKKRILLIDSYPTKRDLRAKILRKMGVEVDCAADISEARSLWQADSYNLVLMDVRRDPRSVDAFCAEMKDAKPPQRMAFLVGKPEYLGAAPGSDGEIPMVDTTRNGPSLVIFRVLQGLGGGLPGSLVAHRGNALAKGSPHQGSEERFGIVRCAFAGFLERCYTKASRASVRCLRTRARSGSSQYRY